LQTAAELDTLDRMHATPGTPIDAWIVANIRTGTIGGMQRDPHAFDTREPCECCNHWQTRGGVYHPTAPKVARVCEACWTIAQPDEHAAWVAAEFRPEPPELGEPPTPTPEP
jgi:hypothetical protein